MKGSFKGKWALIKASVVMMAAVAALLLAAPGANAEGEKDMPKYALAIHGGAGTILRKNMTPEREKAFEDALKAALAAGEKVLAGGGDAVDAVIAVITLMEDLPLFNAGKGAVFTAEGTNELDASIMDGKTLNAGAVAGVKTVRSPIRLARAVMDLSPHVMLQGKGAETFAAENGLEIVDPEYFYTEHRWQQLQKLRAIDPDATALDHMEILDGKFGTVGAAALDTHGNLAAGTSTGGTTNKHWGRVGDSPIIGAGTYASNSSCAVSATGHGEFFIRATVARSICALMEYGGLSLAEAADRIVMKQLVEMGGDGGIISVDKDGHVALVFNTPGMYRGYVQAGKDPVIGIYND